MKRFDPYHLWFGIPPGEQPPNHYRLLGVNLFESDRDVIRNAADQRMTYLKTYGGGVHSELSQKLLNEVSAAKVCLLNHDKKAAYDVWLREQLEPSRVSDMVAELVPSAREEEEQLAPIVPVVERVQPWKPRKKGRPVPRNPRNDSRYLPWILFAVILVVAALLLYLWPNNGTVRIVLSDPSAEIQVQVDGEVVAVSDLKDPLELEPGEHELSVSGPDYESVSCSFTVEQGQETTLPVDLMQLVRVGRVKIAISDPSADVDVKVDGGVIEASRLKKPLELAPGQHELSVRGRGYRDHRQSFTVKSGKTVTVPVELEPIEHGLASTPSDDTATGEDGVRMSFVRIPPGEFMMGAPEDEEDRDEDEGPQHLVRITEAFYLGTTEVTQSQWEAVMGTRPWGGEKDVKKGENYSAVCVSWKDAVAFCKRWSEKEGRTYRLPTEAEWEYACRAGSSAAYCFGDDSSELEEYAWFNDNALGAGQEYAHEVGRKRANDFGLYDMHGNVWEWCSDWYGEDSYDDSLTEDPSGPERGSNRVLRGGSWFDSARYCQSSSRNRGYPASRDDRLGFRVARGPAE